MSQLEKRTETFPSVYGVPYVPVISVAWDSSPRTLPQDGWGKFGYPWGISWRSNLTQWTRALQRTKAFMEKRCSNEGDAVDSRCPPVLINAWNEWSEGAFLEPDQRDDLGRLSAIKSVFGSA